MTAACVAMLVIGLSPRRSEPDPSGRVLVAAESEGQIIGVTSRAGANSTPCEHPVQDQDLGRRRPVQRKRHIEVVDAEGLQAHTNRAASCAQQPKASGPVPRRRSRKPAPPIDPRLR